MEEQINHLPQSEEAAPVPEPEKPPEAKVEQPLSKAGERLSAGMVDEPPNPAALQADVERLREVKRKAEEDAKYWRQQKAEARADYFRDRDRGAAPPPAPPPADVPGMAPEPKAADFTDYDEYVKSGSYSVVPGGSQTYAAGDYGFAAGSRARIEPGHDGVFLYSDHKDVEFASAGPNEFAARATGGVRFVTGIDASGHSLAGVRLSPGSGSWETLSDQRLKTSFSSVDGQEILERLKSVPIMSWR